MCKYIEYPYSAILLLSVFKCNYRNGRLRHRYINTLSSPSLLTYTYRLHIIHVVNDIILMLTKFIIVFLIHIVWYVI
jgi:hypothetical protein